MAQYGGKGGSWGRGAGGQQMSPFGGQMGGMNAFAPSQVGGMGLGGGGMGSMGSGVMPVNSPAFSSSMGSAPGYGGSAGSRSQPGGASKMSNRAYVGVVTKLADNYGFVDDEVFFQTNVVRGAMPCVGDRVMVEANYNPNMAFKWSACRIQLLTGQDRPPMPPQGRGGGRDQRWPDRREQAMPPRRNGAPMPRRERSPRRSPPQRRTPRRSPPIRRPSPSIRPSMNVPGGAKRERSSTRSMTHDTNASRGGSPPRRKPRIMPRYNVLLPRTTSDCKEATVMTLRKRYNKLYIPSDFFHVNYTWLSAFPLDTPFSLDHSCAYHVMSKDVDCLFENDAVLDPPDIDYRYSAKVMLLDIPPYAEMYKRTLGLLEDGTCRSDYEFEPISPNRLIGFLVGMKGKNEVLAIGGPWSASLDGMDPENDPRVLIRTAIRTCKALTGIDLSKCTQWYKFLEIRYRRMEKERAPNASVKDQDQLATTASPPYIAGVDARVDTVVIYVPDVWNVLPTKLEFENLQALLRNQLEVKINELDSPPVQQPTTTTEASSDAVPGATTNEQRPPADSSVQIPVGPPSGTKNAEDEESGANQSPIQKPNQPSHWSLLDTKSMKVNELRAELEARGSDSKGIKSQLTVRLNKLLKTEKEEEEAKSQPAVHQLVAEVVAQEEEKLEASMETVEEVQDEPAEETKPAQDVPSPGRESEKEKQRRKEKEEREKKERRAVLEKHYSLPHSNTGILVFPNRVAKGGRFDCRVMSLHSLLDYRPEDNKEHSFEVATFAEAFNEMLMRDFAFTVYKNLLWEFRREEEEHAAHAAEAARQAAETALKQEQAEAAPENSVGDTEPMETETAAENPENMPTAQDDIQSAEAGQPVAGTDAAIGENKVMADAQKEKKDIKSDKEKIKGKEVEQKEKCIVNAPLFFAFSYFDQGQCGYLMERDMDELLLSLGLRLTRAQIQALTKRYLSQDSIHYRKMVDIPLSKKDAIAEQIAKISAEMSEEELSLGNNCLLPWNRHPQQPSAETKMTPTGRSTRSRAQSAGTVSGVTDVTENSTVLFRGNVVDVSQILTNLERLEREVKAIDGHQSALEKELKNSKESREILERRKRRLEDDMKELKKRLYDAERCLKNSQDDTVLLKTSLHRCKEIGESLCRLVDKALPHKREKEDYDKGRSKERGDAKAAESSENDTQKTTEDGSAAAEGPAGSTEGGAIEGRISPFEELAVKDEVVDNEKFETTAEVHSEGRDAAPIAANQ